MKMLSTLSTMACGEKRTALEEEKEKEEEEESQGKYTQDGTVDLKGNPVVRSKTGGWTACSFIVVYEVFERMAFFGIGGNLVLYLTKKLHQGTVTSANNVTNWGGFAFISPLLGAYFADEHFGRYWTFFYASAIYLLGMFLLTLTVSIPGLKPHSCHGEEHIALGDCKATRIQLGVFYAALYIIALGVGGTKSNVMTIGAVQFDEFEPKEKAHKLSFFNWWIFCMFIGTLLANTILVYIQDNVSWALGYGIPTVGLAISTLIFFAGSPFYRHKLPSGSPFIGMVRVIVASLRKWRAHVPHNLEELYELDLEEYRKKGTFMIKSTPSLRFLNKAAIKRGKNSPWMLCPVTQVEETKQILRMIPILAATFVPSTMVAQANTLFVKQGTTLDSVIGSFKIPSACLLGFLTISILVSIVIYDRLFVRVVKKWTKNPRGITILQRMAIGLVLHIVIMVVASMIERKRLRIAKHHGMVENGGKVPITIFILVPQFILMGMADAILEGGKMEFFYDQAPESMKSLGTSFFSISLGIGCFLSSIILSTVSNVTKRHYHKGWILNNLNDSHLDYYYAFLAILGFLNLIFFMIVTKFYVYREVLNSNSIEVPGENTKGSFNMK